MTLLKPKKYQYHVKNPGIASVLSFLVPGLGSIYNGQILRGVAIFFLVFTGLFFFIIPGIIIWIVGIIDAYQSSEKINSKQR